jgi:hypothetical protein
MQRHRKLPRTSRIMNISHFYSVKNRKAIYCESKIERDALLTLEFDGNIDAYTSQPFSITYELNDKEVRYTPDTLVQTHSGDFYLIEVKPFYAFQLEKNMQKFAHLQSLFHEKYQRELRLMSCRDIYIDVQIPNLDVLYRFKRLKVTQEVEQLFKELPNLIDSTIYQQLCSDKNKIRYNSFMTLLAHDFFNFDVTRPFECQQAVFEKREALCNH